MSTSYDVVVLAGGRARRFGADKLAAEVAGRPLLDHILVALTQVEDPDPPGRVIVVGPPRPVVTGVEVLWCREDPPGGGPVAGLAAAVPLLTAPRVVILGGDMPLAAAAVPALLDAAGGLVPHAAGETGPTGAETGYDGAALISADGVVQPLACVLGVPVLRARLAALGDPTGQPARRLLEGLRIQMVPEPAGQRWSLDVDRPEDLARVQDAYRAPSRGHP